MTAAQPKASHHINGQYCEDTSGRSFESVYPATGEVIATLHSATPEVIEKAVAAARAAQPEWARRPGVERGRILFAHGAAVARAQ
jgi:betaine-aldehyde dehydrogenase